MKKFLILGSSIFIFFLLYGAVMLFMIDYKKMENTLKEISSQNSSSGVIIENLSIEKLPVPKVILTGVKVGLATFDKVTLNIGLKSILLNKPEVSNIVIKEHGAYFNIAVYYENNIAVMAKASGQIQNIYDFITHYVAIPKEAMQNFSDKAVNVKFNITHLENQLNISDLSINSETMNATGEGNLSLEKDLSDIKLNFSNMAIFDDNLENMALDLTFKDSMLYLNNFSGNIASGGNFAIVGNCAITNNIPLFLGNIYIKHSNVNNLVTKFRLNEFVSQIDSSCDFLSEIRLTPIEFSLKNITLNIGTMNIYGASSFKMIGALPRITSKIEISGFDYNKEMPIFSPLIRYFISLKDGMKEQSYVSKFIPLREIKSIGFFDIILNKPIISDSNIDHIKFSGNFLSGKIKIDSFEYKSDNTNLLGTIELSTSMLMPSFSGKISGRVNMDMLNLSNILALNNILYKDYDLSKVKLSWDVNLEKVTRNNIEYNNIKFLAYTEENSIIISNANIDFGNSSIVANGNITIAPDLTFDCGYAYNSMNIRDATSYIISGLNIDGLVSSNGRISSHGSSVEELLYNLSITSKFLADNINIEGYDIDNVIGKINNQDYIFSNSSANELQNNNSYAFSPLEKDLEKATMSGSTRLSKISGSIKMNLGSIVLEDLGFTTAKSKGKLHMFYNIYNNELHLQSKISFPLLLYGSSNENTEFTIILEHNNGLFEKFIDIGKLWSDIKRRPNIIPQNW